MLHSTRNRSNRFAGLMAACLAAALIAGITSQGVAADQSDASRAKRVAAQLAAGEFVAATKTAEETTNATERSALLKQIAEAQMKAGALNAALGTVRRIPEPSVRDATRRKQVLSRESSQGGSGADFTQLIELIQSNTSGPWMEIDGAGGTMSPFETGVRVDPQGLLHRLTRTELSGRLAALGLQARQADLNEDMQQARPMRMVSLTRLAAEVSRRLAAGLPVAETMQHMAGLSRIEHVFIYPDLGEIVIAGPAEGWRYDERGFAVGQDSGRPTLYLDDLVTVLRTFGPTGSQIFGCSINPRPEGLRAIKEYVEQSNARGPISSRAVGSWVRVLQNKLGLQDIQTYGVPADSRAARVIVEADYRMKLIGVGRLDGVKGIENYFDLLPPHLQSGGSNLEALRWWLTMKYDAVWQSQDRNVFSIEGSSVLCQSENQFVTSLGERVQTGQAEETNRLFAQKFTEHYAELAERDIVFADLKNVFDLALLAALINHDRLADRASWDLGSFAAGGAYRPLSYETPQVVDSVVAHRVYNNRDIVVQVAGGVRADLASVVRNDDLRRESPRLGQMAATARPGELPHGRWWWDVKK